jgi:hypothetical protein
MVKMTRKMTTTLAVLAIAIAGAAPGGSDRVGIYAIVDKVVLEPTAQNPERIQIWGAFTLASRQNTNLYDPVQRGYLYFTAASSKELTRTEWNDLKAVAGTGQIVAFASRFGLSARVRGENEKPQAPDRYVMGLGIATMRADRDYAPIRALAAYIDR